MRVLSIRPNAEHMNVMGEKDFADRMMQAVDKIQWQNREGLSGPMDAVYAKRKFAKTWRVC